MENLSTLVRVHGSGGMAYVFCGSGPPAATGRGSRGRGRSHRVVRHRAAVNDDVRLTKH